MSNGTLSSNAVAAGLPGAARLALPLLLLGAVGTAFAPIFVRLSEVGPLATAFWRLALAIPVLWVMSHTEKRRQPGRRRAPQSVRDYVLVSLPGLFFAGDLAFWHLSITMTSVANATLFANFAPVFVTLFGWLVFRYRVSATFIAGLALAMSGAAALIGESLTVSAATLTGDAFGVVTAMFYAGYILTVGRLRATYTTATVMAWSSISNAVALLAVTLLSGESLWVPTLGGWLVLIALTAISHIGGQGLIAYAMAHLPPAFGSVSLLVQPAVAALLAWAILGEPLSVWQGVGGLVILAGIVLARRGAAR